MDAARLLEQFLGNGSPGAGPDNRSRSTTGPTGSGLAGVAGGVAAGGILGLLVGNKKARKTAKSLAGGAVGIGGAAALGAIAYKAYGSWQKRQSQNAHVPATQPVTYAPAVPSPDAEFKLGLIKAMIAAAYADQHIDAEEQRAIFESIDRFSLTADEKALLFDTLRNPPGLEEIAGLPRSPEEAAEIYLASRIAIDPDHPAELAYLQQLAHRLSLPYDLVSDLNQQAAA